MALLEKRDRVLEIQNLIKELETEKATLLKELQNECKHTVIIREREFCDDFRFCVFCGTSEQWRTLGFYKYLSEYDKQKSERLFVTNRRADNFISGRLEQLSPLEKTIISSALNS